jgi:hypothetical protein
MLKNARFTADKKNGRIARDDDSLQGGAGQLTVMLWHSCTPLLTFTTRLMMPWGKEGTPTQLRSPCTLPFR